MSYIATPFNNSKYHKIIMDNNSHSFIITTDEIKFYQEDENTILAVFWANEINGIKPKFRPDEFEFKQAIYEWKIHQKPYTARKKQGDNFSDETMTPSYGEQWLFQRLSKFLYDRFNENQAYKGKIIYQDTSTEQALVTGKWLSGEPLSEVEIETFSKASVAFVLDPCDTILLKDYQPKATTQKSSYNGYKAKTLTHDEKLALIEQMLDCAQSDPRLAVRLNACLLAMQHHATTHSIAVPDLITFITALIQ